MKTLDILSNVVIVLAITVFSSYVTYYYYDIGLLVSLPEGITSFFIQNGALQYVALAILVAAVIGKALIGRAIKRQARRTT
ncbi:hypothetical protein [Microbacterium sp. SA39]|uniref:hypothetical protein n=1 Tax=Microbacterium sp. SA39 TaxID=1263625 RepID=UPI0005F9AD90|nr:hypothetical protein [Microbacterium sp. SA39]KJQ52738.1 hypothetical protein RS85_03632 [Microbacterium sp. SA39]